MIEVREKLGALGKFGKKTDLNTTTRRLIQRTTILLLNVCDLKTGKVVSEHCWVTMGKRFGCLNLKEKDTVTFDARVTTYRKFHRDENGDKESNFHYFDYRLSFPTNLEKVSPKPAFPEAITVKLGAFEQKGSPCLSCKEINKCNPKCCLRFIIFNSNA
jgi:hypothetical protein